jgi:hypothetical protein
LARELWELTAAISGSGENAMTSQHFLAGAAYSPEDVQAMSLAFDDVCKALNLTDADKYARELVASKVIALARTDERNADKLRDLVLREYMTKNSVA